MDNLLTPKQVMARLNISRSTLKKLDREGVLTPAIRMEPRGDRRYTEIDIQKYMQNGRGK